MPSEGTSVSADVSGDVLDALDEWLEVPEVTGVAIEWGTVDIVEVSNALRGDAWLHAHGDPRGSEAVPIKAALRAAFAPDDPQWADDVWSRFSEVTAERVRRSPHLTASSASDRALPVAGRGGRPGRGAGDGREHALAVVRPPSGGPR